MSEKKRTHIDFSKHELLIQTNEDIGIHVHYLKLPGTREHSVKFINCGGILAVTGDFGNWVFCREFIPGSSNETRVSDGYWMEKLKIASTQEGEEFDQESTQKELQSLIDKGYEEYGYEGEQLEEMKEYARDCIRHMDDGEIPYRAYAMENLPSFSDYESIVFHKKTKFWLLCIFDAFEECCRKLMVKAVEEAK